MRRGGWAQNDIDGHHTIMSMTLDRSSGDGWMVCIPGRFHVNLSAVSLLAPRSLHEVDRSHRREARTGGRERAFPGLLWPASQKAKSQPGGWL
jgi:hypothetical protein